VWGKLPHIHINGDIMFQTILKSRELKIRISSIEEIDHLNNIFIDHKPKDVWFFNKVTNPETQQSIVVFVIFSVPPKIFNSTDKIPYWYEASVELLLKSDSKCAKKLLSHLQPKKPWWRFF